MCVDDDDLAAFSLALLLEHAGCEVMVCKSSQDALCAARDFLPDVCLIDICMPGMNGCELAARMREQSPLKPPRCIAVTGLWDFSAANEAYGVHFADHFIKPVDLRALVECVTAGVNAHVPA